MRYVIIPSADAIQVFYTNLVSMVEIQFDINLVLSKIVEVAAKHDIGGCVDYDTLTLFDDAFASRYNEDNETFRRACMDLTLQLRDIFRQCHLYHQGSLPYRYGRVLGYDLVLIPISQEI